MNNNLMTTSEFQEFMRENPKRGYLKVRAYAASEAIPISGLSITVTKKIGNNDIVFFEGVTDNSGMTEKIELPSPPLPTNNMEKPQKTSYDVIAYYSKDNLTTKYSVNIYEGVCVLQNVNIVPDMKNVGGI